MTQVEAKQKIQGLVEKYDRIMRDGKVGEYKEARTLSELILPLFSALGWDMENKLTDGEVVPEENVSHGMVDRAFRLGGIPVMFLEAKSLKTGVDDQKSAEQAINYSWNKGVTWAVLSDFESVKIFNAETPPKNIMRDNLFIEIDCHDFLSKFDDLWLLSKQGFSERLLDKKAEQYGKMARRKPVNTKLFEDMMTWRASLERQFKRNNRLADEDVYEGVQRILDRLIFIRSAEDRKIEPNVLLEIQRSHTSVYKKLIKLFREFDDGYNSRLFAPHACEKWEADDKTFSEVIGGLYETSDGYRYNFSAIPSDVLGGMYEQYLTFRHKRKQNNVGSEKSKRKKQGIYYTPKYIVEFIVRNTIGKVLVGKRKRISTVKILDPACGSGSFLIAAFDEVLANLDKPTVFSKFEVLQENIFGIDMDAQAVEIAQSNLLLNLLSQRTKLPLLQHNILKENALLTDHKEKYDVVLGNPPYIKEFTNKSAFDGLRSSPYYQGKMDIWTLFACQAIDHLKDGGYFSFIAPNNWITNFGASKFRDKILSEGEIIKFVNFGDYKVFQDAGIQTMIFIFQKRKPRASYQVTYSKVLDKDMSELEVASWLLGQNRTEPNKTITFSATLTPKKLMGRNIVFVDSSSGELLAKIRGKMNFSLTEKEVAQGIVGNPDDAFVFPENGQYTEPEKSLLFDFYTSVERYSAGLKRGLVAYLDKKVDGLQNMPHIKSQLEGDLAHLKSRREVKNGRIEWFHLHWPRDERFFEKGEKIVAAIRTSCQKFFFTEDEYYGSRALNFIKTDRINLKFLLGLFNSRLSYYWLKTSGKQLGDLLQVDKGPLLGIPISKPTDKIQKDIAGEVDALISLYRSFRQVMPNTDRWNNLKADISKAQTKIDKKIYALYDLTELEIQTIESIPWEPV